MEANLLIFIHLLKLNIHVQFTDKIASSLARITTHNLCINLYPRILHEITSMYI